MPPIPLRDGPQSIFLVGGAGMAVWHAWIPHFPCIEIEIYPWVAQENTLDQQKSNDQNHSSWDRTTTAALLLCWVVVPDCCLFDYRIQIFSCHVFSSSSMVGWLYHVKVCYSTEASNPAIYLIASSSLIRCKSSYHHGNDFVALFTYFNCCVKIKLLGCNFI